MRVIAKRTLRDFWQKHGDAEQPLKSWYHEAILGNWNNFNDIKREFPRASILKNNRVCFNIKGNNYRLIIQVNFNI